ncbi:hypothetical protein K523DRAFT_382738, partial [Schizophyllum commune Tattone D]
VWGTDTLDQILNKEIWPRFIGDLEYDSVAVVVYTTNRWGRDKVDRIAFNIHSVVLVADPPETTSAAAATKIKRDYLARKDEPSKKRLTHERPTEGGSSGDVGALALAVVRLRALVVAGSSPSQTSSGLTNVGASLAISPASVVRSGQEAGSVRLPAAKEPSRFVVSERLEGHKSTAVAVQRDVPYDIFENIVRFCGCEDLPSLALGSSRLSSVIRARRLRRIVISDATYFDFREWLYQVSMVHLINRSAFQTPVPGLNITVPISESMQDELNRYLREVVFPDQWTRSSASFVKVLAAMKPLGVETLVLGGRRMRTDWFDDLQVVWEPSTMDDLIAAVKTVVFLEPTQSGLHFVLTRKPSTRNQRLCEYIDTVK